MNISNIDKAIAIMKRAGNFNMKYWQRVPHSDEVAKTEAQLHACGNSACFAGWVAVSPEFQADGGDVAGSGAPIIMSSVPYWKFKVGPEAIAHWLDIEPKLAEALCAYGTEGGEFSYLYRKPLSEITPADVIQQLELLKA